MGILQTVAVEKQYLNRKTVLMLKHPRTDIEPSDTLGEVVFNYLLGRRHPDSQIAYASFDSNVSEWP